ncbi:uncharacterized protein LOC126745178 [Anthonomus grandis grandis]|uniref:uncharacterized protein LOC126745178 n=1 Tax=Anthonomus grandis grandis TaxID=2921223 RepID=UPI0021667707|nr:uncharacterized protein LOC126745178 [Anthonomus grandis grandis]
MMRSLVCFVFFVVCVSVINTKAQDDTKGSILLKRLARHARRYSSSSEEPWRNWEPVPRLNWDDFFNSSRPRWHHHHDWHHHNRHNPCTCQKPQFPEFQPPPLPPNPKYPVFPEFPCFPGSNPPFPPGCKVSPPQPNSTETPENMTTTINPLLPSTTGGFWGMEWPDLQDKNNTIEEELPGPEIA